ncbi:hypothetical protein SCP_0114380 [Sparassis crispa]|uniref:Xylosidase/arabinosidase n=1 Tax=Sparassis crispa TaxID=139825 RepID=A0A401G8S6_9APHY|nr:hypothetical protein SCP_0114380 [Sparassis crispa]GBE78549.1 hypothetical protein SCP_0114380 [Sparassis crispa]
MANLSAQDIMGGSTGSTIPYQTAGDPTLTSGPMFQREQTFLFSSRHPKTVQRHFHWMAQHGVDGAFLQRFAGQCDVEDGGNLGIRNQRDEVGDRVKEAAEKEGRVFAIMYDVSGVAPERIQKVIEHDWHHLIYEKSVLDSPNYLREKGKAVVTFWGFGFADSRHDPATVRAITAFIRNNTPGGAYIMAGSPAYWRTSTSDADRNPEFVNVWLEEFDAISPWTIGRYGSPEDADRHERENIKGDLELIRKRNEHQHSKRQIDYIPVVFPGGSGYNLSEGKWGWNDIPRRGGRFLWRQLYNARRNGIRIIYGAMWDEYDEGTAFLPVVPHQNQLPVLDNYKFMALDEDGLELPSDWYMRICGFAVESLRGQREIEEAFPEKELQDYWSSRPKGADLGSGSADPGGSKSKPFEEWEKLENEGGKIDDVPPPPYSLELNEALAEQQSRNVSSSPPQPRISTRPPTGQSSRHYTTIQATPSAPPVVSTSRPSIPSSPVNASPRTSPVVPETVNSLADSFHRQSIGPPPSPYTRTASTGPAANQSTSPPSASGFHQSVSQPLASRPSQSSSPASAPWPPPSWGLPPAQRPPQPPHLSYTRPNPMHDRPHSGGGPSPPLGHTYSYPPGATSSPPPPLMPRPYMPMSHTEHHPERPQGVQMPTLNVGAGQCPAPYATYARRSSPSHPHHARPPEHGAESVQFPQAYAPPSPLDYTGQQQPFGGYPYLQSGPPPGPDPQRFPAHYGSPPPPHPGHSSGPTHPRPNGPPPGQNYMYLPPPGPPPPVPPTHPQRPAYQGAALPAGPSLSANPVGYAKNAAHGITQASKEFYKKHLK